MKSTSKEGFLLDFFFLTTFSKLLGSFSIDDLGTVKINKLKIKNNINLVWRMSVNI